MADTAPARRHRDGHAESYAPLTPSNPYSPSGLHQFQDLRLQSSAYTNQHLQTQPYQPQSSAAVSGPSARPSDRTPGALYQDPQFDAHYADWAGFESCDSHPQFSPHIQVEDHTSAFSDWSSFDFSHGFDASAYQRSPLLRPYFQQEHKRASSSSSHASFGEPSTPRPTNASLPQVEVLDTDRQGFHAGGQDDIHWPEDIAIPVSEDEVKQFRQVFGTQDAGGQVDNFRAHPIRDAQRLLQDPRIRQLMMSQESTASSSRMGPPALPRTESTGSESGYRGPPDPSLPKLDRTMSDIYQDSLYNPNFHQAPESPPKSKPATQDTSPQSNHLQERLATANHDHLKAQSQSPTGPIVRERSPFKPNAPESPRQDTFDKDDHDPVPRLGSAYRMREWQKAQRDRAAAAQHGVSQIKAELNQTPKTISPKEVALDYEEDETAAKMGSLFPEEPPVKRRKQEHSTVPLKPAMTRESTRGSNASEASQPSFGSMATSRRESSQSNGRSQMNYPFFAQAQRQASNASNATATTENTIDFPAHLTSTESTKSDQEYNPSRKRGLNAGSPTKAKSQQEAGEADPEDLTYTCTYHGCTKRFDSQAGLQKHKRDIHHSTAHHSRNTSLTGPATPASPATSSRTASVSAANIGGQANSNYADPEDIEDQDASPGAIADRNSQAGPHICNRINPSTGRPCNSHFSRPYDLTRHEDTIHNNKKQKVRCMYCKDEKTFSRNDALTRHMRVVHPEVQFAGKEKKGGR